MSSIQGEARGNGLRLQGIIDAIRLWVSGVFRALGPILMRSLPIGLRATKISSLFIQRIPLRLECS